MISSHVEPTVALACILAVAMTAGCQVEESATTTHWVYFGTGAQHIYVAPFNEATGELGEAAEAAEIGRPGFLAVHPQGDRIYAVGRSSAEGSPPEGFAAAYGIDSSTGGLTELNRSATAGSGAAHVSVSAEAAVLAAVNYGDGNTVTLALEPDGRLGQVVSDIAHEGSSVHEQRQQQPHPHAANFTPDDRFLVVPDLGTDELVVYAVDLATGRLEPRPDLVVPTEPGAGPRHMTFHPNGRWAYVINELASTVTGYSYESGSGVLRPLQTIGTLPEGYDGPANTTAEVLVHPDGHFLYGSNRGSNTIAVFSLDASNGLLTAQGHAPTGGDWPRNFRLSPSGRFLLVANQRSDDIHVFSVDGTTGALTPTGTVIQVPSPMCVRFVPAG